MNAMKTAIFRQGKWLLGALLGILGFGGCNPSRYFRCEYGVPRADFKLIGDVKDSQGKGIEGIRVVFQPSKDNVYDNDTIYSDAKGHFEIERLRHDWPDDVKDATVKFEDVDGSAHGSFKTKTLERSQLTVGQDQDGDGNWYSGGYTVRADAVLETED